MQNLFDLTSVDGDFQVCWSKNDNGWTWR